MNYRFWLIFDYFTGTKFRGQKFSRNSFSLYLINSEFEEFLFGIGSNLKNFAEWIFAFIEQVICIFTVTTTTKIQIAWEIFSKSMFCLIILISETSKYFQKCYLAEQIFAIDYYCKKFALFNFWIPRKSLTAKISVLKVHVTTYNLQYITLATRYLLYIINVNYILLRVTIFQVLLIDQYLLRLEQRKTTEGWKLKHDHEVKIFLFNGKCHKDNCLEFFIDSIPISCVHVKY